MSFQIVIALEATNVSNLQSSHNKKFSCKLLKLTNLHFEMKNAAEKM